MREFLNLPARSEKPRTNGRTNLLDKGTGLGTLEALLDLAGGFVDVAKLGWGTSVITPRLEDKIALYRAHDVEVCCGGTLFELAYARGCLDEYRAWMKDLGLKVMEVSDGTVDIPTQDKLRHIESFSADFEVYSEVGSKDATVVVSPSKWVKAIDEELKAGARYVILEGRESGTAGMYRQSGEIRMGLIDDIVEGGVDVERLVFETPQKAQQAWIIERLGSEVNLGNIPPEDALSVETLRLGLRADTLPMLHLKDQAGS